MVSKVSYQVALILTPSETAFYDPRYFHFSNIPLTLGVLQGYLRKQGFLVKSTDLNTCMVKYAHQPQVSTWLPIYDKNLITRHLTQGYPTGMEDVLDDFLKQTAASESNIVGISTGTNMSFFEIHMAFLLGRRVQTQMKKPVVFGGANLDFLWQFRETFEDLWAAIFKNFEYLFLGPGESSFAELIKGFAGQKGNRSYKDLPGAIYFKNGQLFHNPEDAHTLVRPDFRGLNLKPYTLCCQVGGCQSDAAKKNLIHFYKLPVIQHLAISESNRRRLPVEERKETLFLPYVFNYNCTYRCAFCVQSRENKSPVISKDARSVVDDIEALMAEHDTQYFRFYNNAFNLSPKFVREFCHLVIERGLGFFWCDCARFDTMSEELVDLMYRAGCRKLVFGLDTASRKILKLIDKRIDLDQARQVLHWCHQRGIWAEVEVIVGLPHETEEDFKATYDFVQENLNKGYLTGFHVNRYFIIPCSRLGSEPEVFGIRIHKERNAYERMLQEREGYLAAVLDPKGDVRGISAHPHQIWTYHEQGGRSSEQIMEETDDKFKRMRGLVPRQ